MKSRKAIKQNILDRLKQLLAIGLAGLTGLGVLGTIVGDQDQSGVSTVAPEEQIDEQLDEQVDEPEEEPELEPEVIEEEPEVTGTTRIVTSPETPSPEEGLSPAATRILLVIGAIVVIAVLRYLFRGKPQQPGVNLEVPLPTPTPVVSSFIRRR